MGELKEVLEYWARMSEEKWKTAEALMKMERYADVLFFVHLSLEAELKAVVVQHTGAQAPFIHNLPKLALLAELKTTAEQERQLREINTFNVRARYDDYKATLFKLATREYTENQLDASKQLRLWIRNNRPKSK